MENWPIYLKNLTLDLMYSPRERKRVKIWNKAKPNGEFQNGDDDKRDLKAVLCLAALHLCASVTAHLFCRLPASSSASNHFNFQHPPSTIVKLPQNSYVRMQKERRTRMNVGTSSSKPAPDQMAAEMRRCCQLQASSSMHRSYPWHLFVVVFTVLFWICCFENINSG